jgi:small subunit ribosomal protein S20
MANTKSAEKRVRKTKNETARNRAVKSRVKGIRKIFLAAIESGDKAAAGVAFKKLASAADRAAKTGVIHKNSASRLKRSNAARVAALA